MVVSHRRDEGCLYAKALHQREAEHTTVDSRGSVETCDLQMNVPDAGARSDRPAHGRHEA